MGGLAQKTNSVKSAKSHKHPFPYRHRGFALVVTLSLMILLTLIAVGLLGLSSVSLRASSQGNSQAQAMTNARLALMIALGELQKEMGPDMRVSASASILDTSAETAEIEGVAEPHWLATYDSWGNWLNAPYDVPGKGAKNIGDTYTAGRNLMFRKWLVSMPENEQNTIGSAKTRSTGINYEVLVGEKSVADTADYVRAPLVNVVKNGQTTGKYAWWVGGENQKARVNKANRQRTLTNAQWEAAQGDTAEMGVGKLSGLGALDANQTVGDKLITTATTRLAGVQDADLKLHFHDLTARSQGVLASVRTGRLKKDLSLLFEKPKADLPDGSLPDDPVNYRFSSGDVREPSIRPMSPEIANRAVLKNRHFASWTRMRHFYRMYRQDMFAHGVTDCLALGRAGSGRVGIGGEHKRAG